MSPLFLFLFFFFFWFITSYIYDSLARCDLLPRAAHATPSRERERERGSAKCLSLYSRSHCLRRAHTKLNNVPTSESKSKLARSILSTCSRIYTLYPSLRALGGRKKQHTHSSGKCRIREAKTQSFMAHIILGNNLVIYTYACARVYTIYTNFARDYNPAQTAAILTSN